MPGSQHLGDVGTVDTVTSVTAIDEVTQSKIVGETNDNVFKSPRVDIITHALINIEHAEHETGQGNHYFTSYEITTAATDGHRTGIYLQTPTGTSKLFNLVLYVSASAAADGHILEGITIDANEGTNGVAIYNRYRDSTNTSTVLDNATSPAANKVTTWTETQIDNGNFSEGTVLEHFPIPAGTGPKAVGGTERSTQKWILAANTKYMFMIENVGANANRHIIQLDWTEWTPRTA